MSGVKKPLRADAAPADFPAGEEFLTVRELAARYRVSQRSIWRWIDQGRLPTPVRVGEGTTRVRLSELLKAEAAFEAGGAR